MNKNELTVIIAKWLEGFLLNRYGDDFNIEVIIPESNFSKIANESLKKVDGYTSLDFHTDVLGILENKKTKSVKLVLLNRSISAISLKEIGEMNCYSKLMNPKHSFLVSLKGLPEEVNLILLQKEMEQKLLKINTDLEIIVFKWDEDNSKIDPLTVFPIEKRTLIL